MEVRVWRAQAAIAGNRVQMVRQGFVQLQNVGSTQERAQTDERGVTVASGQSLLGSVLALMEGFMSADFFSHVFLFFSTISIGVRAPASYSQHLHSFLILCPRRVSCQSHINDILKPTNVLTKATAPNLKLQTLNPYTLTILNPENRETETLIACPTSKSYPTLLQPMIVFSSIGSLIALAGTSMAFFNGMGAGSIIGRTGSKVATTGLQSSLLCPRSWLSSIYSSCV